jgi:hypothetical protein
MIVYRNVLLCQMLSIVPEDHALFIRILSSTLDFKKYFLDNPTLTVALVSRCSDGFETGWSLESLQENLEDFRSLFDVALASNKSVSVLAPLI